MDKEVEQALTYLEDIERVCRDSDFQVGFYKPKLDAIKNVLIMCEHKKIVGTTTINKALEKFLLDNCPDAKKKYQVIDIFRRKKVRLDYLEKTETSEQYNHAMKIEFDYREERYASYLLTDEEYILTKEVVL